MSENAITAALRRMGYEVGQMTAHGFRTVASTLLNELERSDQEVGFVTMCCGGGLGTGTLIQRI